MSERKDSIVITRVEENLIRQCPEIVPRNVRYRGVGAAKTDRTIGIITHTENFVFITKKSVVSHKKSVSARSIQPSFRDARVTLFRR